jgi:membrane protein YdbS with pleckstrin-like domain
VLTAQLTARRSSELLITVRLLLLFGSSRVVFMQRSAMAFPQDNSADREQVVGVHPHWYRLAVPALRVPVVLVLAIVGVSFVPPEEGEAIQYVIIAVAVGLLVRYSVLPWLRWKRTRYVVTTERLVVIEGVVRRFRTDIPLSHIDEVESHSNLIEHLFGCGTLVVSGRDGRGRLELPSMPNFSVVGSTLYQLAHGSR